jgi:predicted nucleotidyltransferase
VLNQDFKEFIKSLNDKNVRYLIVGGYAVAFHGHPRYTKDLDVWIEMTKVNAHNVVAALEQFGFASLQLTEEDFLEENQVIQLGYPPSRIDLLTSADGVNFADCFNSRVSVEIDGITVHFIDLENLVKNKRATGRPQDIADLQKLQ